MRARFYIAKKLADKAGDAPIYLSIHHRNHRLRYYIGERINPSHWDSKKQRVSTSYVGADSLNDLLDVLANEPKEIERNARISGHDCTVEYLKERLSYNKNKPVGFLDLMDEFIRSEGERNSWTAGTEKRWRYVRNNLAKFNKHYRLEFDSINDTFVEKFISHHVKLGWGNATMKKHVSCTVQFVRWARKKGYHESNSYRDIEVKIRLQRPETNVVFLSIDEIARLNHLTFSESESRLEKARDTFLFACFTGLRHSDLKNLKRSDIKNGDLVITSQKTGDSIRVPIVGKARDILDKYKDSGDINPLPVQSQQRYNDYLKTVGKRAGLTEMVTRVNYRGRERVETTLPKWELLSSHVARKTFITTAVFLRIPLETVRRITGHKSDAIEAYYKIMDSEKRVAMQKFENLKIS